MNRRLRHTWAAIVTVLFVLMVASAGWASSQGMFNGFPIVNVKVNGIALQTDVPAIKVSNRTMLPVRAVAEALGASVSWDEESQTASLTTTGGSSPVDPNYLVVNPSETNYTEQIAKVAGNPVYEGAILLGFDRVVILEKKDIESYISGGLSADALLQKAKWYQQMAAPLAQEDQPSSDCTVVYDIMAIQYDRIMNQMGDSGKRWTSQVWGKIGMYWAPVLEQRQCTKPTRADVGQPAKITDSATCSAVRAIAEENRRNAVSQVMRKLAANGTLGGTQTVNLLWDANLQWDLYLLDQDCRP